MEVSLTEESAIVAINSPPRILPSYPQNFAHRLIGRVRRPLGDRFGLTRFGVNLTSLEPGGQTSLHHRHRIQDEFIYVLQGRPTLVTDDGEAQLCSGMCAGFPANGKAHHLENRSEELVLILEIGDRTSGDSVEYPLDDLEIVFLEGGDCMFTNKRGEAY